MADAIITVIITVILTRVAKIMDEQVRKPVKLIRGVEKELKKLRSQFESIQAVLVDAENREVKEESVKLWLEKLKDVASETELVLSEWTEGQGSRQSSHPIKKVCAFLTLLCFGCDRVVFRRTIALKIKKINERLSDIALEKERYEFNEYFTGSESRLKRPKSTSFINVSSTVLEGRDVETKTIINRLLSDENENDNLNIVSIVGARGIGKTTLAQLVYNSNDVIQHFDRRIWVCASDPFDEVQVAKGILEDFTSEAPCLFELETISRKIRNHVEGNKILLVLDDVSTDGVSKWEQLFDSLRTGVAGSTIIVTTTKESVAKLMGSSCQLPLGELSNNDSWSLFEKIAFLGRSTEDRERLEDVGKMIARKCQGLPLTIKRTGMQMRSTEYTLEDWQHVLNTEFCD